MNNSSVKDIRDIDRYMALKPVNDAGMEFFSPFSEPFRLSGSAFQKQLQSRLRRIPIEPVINEKVDWLADYTAGMQLQFKSSSRKVVVKAKLKFSNLRDKYNCDFIAGCLFIVSAGLNDFIGIC